MKLGFDLDEVVIDLTKQFEIYLASTYGIDWPAECFVTYHFEACTFHHDPEFNQRVIDDMMKVANEPELHELAEPVEGAREALQKLARQGHKIVFITHRPKQLQPSTFKWLRQNDIPFHNLEVIGHTGEKGLYGRKHSLDMFVDDLVSNLESMWRYKKKWRKGLILFDKPWNSTPIDGSRFTRIKDWQALLRHIGIQNR